MPCEFCFLFTDDSQSRAAEKEETDQQLHTQNTLLIQDFLWGNNDAKAVPNLVCEAQEALQPYSRLQKNMKRLWRDPYVSDGLFWSLDVDSPLSAVFSN